jgi:membrane protease YdiL (CAAX protease family)
MRWLYIISGVILYATAALYLHFSFGMDIGDMLPTLLIVGIGLTVLVWLLTRNMMSTVRQRVIRGEVGLIAVLVVWIGIYITFGGSSIDRLLPAAWVKDEQVYSIIVLLRKLAVFVVVPLLVYRLLGFKLVDFGFREAGLKLFSRRGLILLTLTSAIAICFQFYFSNAGRSLREQHFTWTQVFAGFPLAAAWLFVEAGLVEEFFFRALLQSRLTALLKSPSGGIVVTAVVFGLTHAPGLFLRSAESEGIAGALPFSFFCAYTIVFMSVAGIFLGLIWDKTRNIWLVMAIHAMVDLLPFIKGFLHTWNIQ